MVEMVTRITSASNRVIKQLRDLAHKKGRIQWNAFIIEGLKLVEEALMHQVSISFFVVADSFLPEFEAMVDGMPGRMTAPVYLVPDYLLKRVSTTETPQGVLAVALASESGGPVPYSPWFKVRHTGATSGSR